MPEIILPEMALPDMPEIGLPEMALPEMPEIRLPAMPEMSLPPALVTMGSIITVPLEYLGQGAKLSLECSKMWISKLVDTLTNLMVISKDFVVQGSCGFFNPLVDLF